MGGSDDAKRTSNALHVFVLVCWGIGWCQNREKIDWLEAHKFDCRLVRLNGRGKENQPFSLYKNFLLHVGSGGFQSPQQLYAVPQPSLCGPKTTPINPLNMCKSPFIDIGAWMLFADAGMLKASARPTVEYPKEQHKREIGRSEFPL